MASGILSTRNLYQNVVQAVYVNNNDLASSITVNICNKNKSEIKVYMAISTSPTVQTDAEWLEYDVTVYPNGVLLRSNLMVPTGYYVVVKTTGTHTNVVVYGQEIGESVESPITISENTGVAPTWITSTTLSNVFSGEEVSLQIEADAVEDQTLSYSLISGTLPTGLSLSADGEISGTVSNSGYVSGKAPDNYSFQVRATDSGNATSTRTFNITRRWNDGSSSAVPGTSAEQIKNLTGTSTNGLYYIRTPDMTSVQQVFCIMDGSMGDGGWMSAFNILSNTTSGIPGGAADWYNTSFWDSTTGFNVGSTLTSNFKNNLYHEAKINQVGILLHNISDSSFRGYGSYIVSSEFQGLYTLYDLCGGGTAEDASIDNKIITGSRYQGSGMYASGAVRNLNRGQSTWGDIFVDQNNSGSPLKFRARGQWSSDGGSANNAVRIATSLGDRNDSYGHTYAGIGGTHQHSGWRGDFAMAPVSAYCDGPQSYGDRGDGVNMTSYSGWSFPYSTSCTNFNGGPGQLNVGYGIFIK